MTPRYFCTIFFYALGGLTAFSSGQDPHALNGADWRQSNLITHNTVVPHWSADGNSFWYRTHGDDQAWIVDAHAHQKRLATDSECAAFPKTSLPALSRIHPGRGSIEEITITFINNTGDKAWIEWINPQSEARPYGTVAAGERSMLQTFTGHVWRVHGSHGDTLGVYQAVASDGEAVLDSKSAGAGGARQDRRAKPASV